MGKFLHAVNSVKGCNWTILEILWKAFHNWSYVWQKAELEDLMKAGCGEKFLLSQQLIKNGATRVVAIDPQVDFNAYMLWRQLNMGNMDISFHVMPKKIQDIPELIQNKYQEILLVFARPCHSNWVEESLNLKGENVEALYITVPQNIEEYDDLGVWKEKAVLLEHKGSSADKEVIYSIK
jgi:hypothetical protein